MPSNSGIWVKPIRFNGAAVRLDTDGIETWFDNRTPSHSLKTVSLYTMSTILRNLLRATRQQHGFQRVEDDVIVQRQRHIFDVIQIVLELFDRVFQSVAVFVIDLCPSRNSRPDAMPLAVIGNLFGKRLHEFRAFRP